MKKKHQSKLRATGLCEGNSPVTGEFPAHRASNAENVSTWWSHHVIFLFQGSACESTLMAMLAARSKAMKKLKVEHPNVPDSELGYVSTYAER